MKAGVVVDNEFNFDKRVLREIEILRESGYEVSVICYAFDGEIYEPPMEGIDITRIRISRRNKNILMFLFSLIPVYELLWSRWIKNFIIKNGIDILHVHDLYMSRAARGGIRKSGSNIPMILDLHENFPYTIATYNWTKGLLRNLIAMPGIWLKKEGEYLRLANRFVVLSEAFRDSLVAKYPDLDPASFAVLPNVPNLEKIKSMEVKPIAPLFMNADPVIFYYGVIAERRGIFDALRIFRRLVEDGHKANFLLIGPVDKTDKQRFEQVITDRLLSSRVHFIPWIDLPLFWSYIPKTDICLAPFHKNPQHESGVANKVFEYMLGKKPVIVSDCKPQRDLVLRYECGLVFKNDAEFLDALIKLLNDKALRETMGENGFRAIMNDYNTITVRDNLLHLYNGLIR